MLRSGVKALSSATQHAMLPKFGGKWGTKCLNTRMPMVINMLFFHVFYYNYVQGVGPIATLKNHYIKLIYFCCFGRRRVGLVSTFNTQCLEKTTKNEKQSALALSFPLWLPAVLLFSV